LIKEYCTAQQMVQNIFNFLISNFQVGKDSSNEIALKAVFFRNPLHECFGFSAIMREASSIRFVYPQVKKLYVHNGTYVKSFG
jgi:hypothetical protein